MPEGESLTPDIYTKIYELKKTKFRSHAQL